MLSPAKHLTRFVERLSNQAYEMLRGAQHDRYQVEMIQALLLPVSYLGLGSASVWLGSATRRSTSFVKSRSAW
jgi:hypothetical protein